MTTTAFISKSLFHLVEALIIVIFQNLSPWLNELRQKGGLQTRTEGKRYNTTKQQLQGLSFTNNTQKSVSHYKRDNM